MSIKSKVIGLNKFLTTIYDEETQLSSVLMRLGLEPGQIEVLKNEHLEYIVNSYVALVQQRIVDRRTDGERLYKIISRRFELDGKLQSTLQSLGKELGISRERVRQLEKKAIRSYKAKANKKFLEDGLFQIVVSLLPDLQRFEMEKSTEIATEGRRSGSRKNYREWSQDELLLLKQRYNEGMTIQELADLLGRSHRSIEMRLGKGWQLQAAKEYVDENFLYKWVPVYQGSDEKYLFPNPITDFMLENYGESVVYRWIACRDDATIVIYVGTTHKLCPDRLNAYLSDDPKGVNKRLQPSFLEYVGNGYNLELEILSFEQFVITPKHLSVGHVRYFVEKLFINYYQQIEQPLLNKSM